MSAPPIRHLGIVDWGIGGLDLRRRLRSARPALATSYLSDAGFTPYGKLSAEALVARLRRVLDFLAAQGVDSVLLACNAASSELPRLGVDPGLPVLGVIAPTVAALLDGGARDVAILGGERTIRSRAYEAPLVAAGVRVRSVVAQPLSALVEAGELSGSRLEAQIAAICAGLEGVETLVPACTHYSAVLPGLLRAIAPQQVVDPAAQTLRCLLERLPADGAPAGPSAPVPQRVYTTGDVAQTRRSATLAFGVQLATVTPVNL